MEAHRRIDLLTAIHGGEIPLELRRPEACSSCGGEGGTGKRSCPRCKGRGRVTERHLGMQAVVSCQDCAGSGKVFSQECPACAGAGRTMALRKLKVRIPAGVKDGQVVRLRGLGGQGRQGGPPGNLLLTVGILPHPFLVRKGDDLELELPILLAEALAGGQVTVPTPDGDVKLRIPAGSQNGQRLRLKERGLPSGNGRRGHLYLVLRPQVPVSEDPRALELAQELDGYGSEDPRQGMEL